MASASLYNSALPREEKIEFSLIKDVNFKKNSELLVYIQNIMKQYFFVIIKSGMVSLKSERLYFIYHFYSIV